MFELWMLYVILSIIAIIIEIFAPSLFCINFAFGGIITAIISIFWGDLYTTLIIFAAISVISLIFIKPLLTKLIKKQKFVALNVKIRMDLPTVFLEHVLMNMHINALLALIFNTLIFEIEVDVPMVD